MIRVYRRWEWVQDVRLTYDPKVLRHFTFEFVE